ncbi:MAG: MFS transporter, partial [Chloroflexota bacterium]|nr:MFS transporter [Chloroflexota bacterium]
MQRSLNGRVYYGWIVVGVTAVTLITSAGERSVPGVLIHPLEQEFGWSAAAISVAISIGLLLFGLMGPIAGRLMDRSGPRRLMVIGLLLIVVSTSTSAAMTQLWQLVLLWGVVSGIGTGMVATVLGAAVANRWFVEKRGLVMGIFGGATSAGQLLFVQLNVRLIVTIGWRGAVLVLAGVAVLVLVPVLFLMENSPADVGAEPYGGVPQPAAIAGTEAMGGIMRRAVRVPEFWLLAGSFFVCGATSNGLIGTHFIAHSVDHGISQTTAASALALMGAMNFVGTIGSGFLTDRYDPRKLLACYYTFRGLSLLILPFVSGFAGLAVFAVFFGLDYIATVPPTATLAADIFGRKHVGIVFGWIFCAHQFGAASAAYFGGLIRSTLGAYSLAFIVGGIVALTGGILAMRIDRTVTAFTPVYTPEV